MALTNPTVIHTPPGVVGSQAIVVNTPNTTIPVGGSSFYERSTDGGATWDRVTEPVNGIGIAQERIEHIYERIPPNAGTWQIRLTEVAGPNGTGAVVGSSVPLTTTFDTDEAPPEIYVATKRGSGDSLNNTLTHTVEWQITVRVRYDDAAAGITIDDELINAPGASVVLWEINEVSGVSGLIAGQSGVATPITFDKLAGQEAFVRLTLFTTHPPSAATGNILNVLSVNSPNVYAEVESLSSNNPSQFAEGPLPDGEVVCDGATAIGTGASRLQGRFNTIAPQTGGFQYRVAGDPTWLDVPGDTAATGTTESYAEPLNGLTAATDYEYRAVIRDGGGVVQASSAPCTFTTADGVAQNATCSPATSVTETTATINGSFTGSVNSTAQLQYRGQNDLDWTNAGAAVAGTGVSQNISAPVTGLTANTSYETRVVVTSTQNGETLSPSCQFQTLSASTGTATCDGTSSVTDTQARVFISGNDVSAPQWFGFQVIEQPSGTVIDTYAVAGSGLPDQNEEFIVSGLTAETNYDIVPTVWTGDPDAGGTIVTTAGTACDFTTLVAGAPFAPFCNIFTRSRSALYMDVHANQADTAYFPVGGRVDYTISQPGGGGPFVPFPNPYTNLSYTTPAPDATLNEGADYVATGVPRHFVGNLLSNTEYVIRAVAFDHLGVQVGQSQCGIFTWAEPNPTCVTPDTINDNDVAFTIPREPPVSDGNFFNGNEPTYQGGDTWTVEISTNPAGPWTVADSGTVAGNQSNRTLAIGGTASGLTAGTEYFTRITVNRDAQTGEGAGQMWQNDPAACSFTTTTSAVPDIVATKVYDPTPANPTQAPADITSLLTITNNGTGPGSTLVDDPIPASPVGTLRNFTAVETGGVTGFTAVGTGPINETITLPPGASITYTIVDNVRGAGSYQNIATVGGPDGPGGPIQPPDGPFPIDPVTPVAECTGASPVRTINAVLRGTYTANGSDSVQHEYRQVGSPTWLVAGAPQPGTAVSQNMQRTAAPLVPETDYEYRLVVYDENGVEVATSGICTFRTAEFVQQCNSQVNSRHTVRFGLRWDSTQAIPWPVGSTVTFEANIDGAGFSDPTLTDQAYMAQSSAPAQRYTSNVLTEGVDYTAGDQINVWINHLNHDTPVSMRWTVRDSGGAVISTITCQSRSATYPNPRCPTFSNITDTTVNISVPITPPDVPGRTPHYTGGDNYRVFRSTSPTGPWTLIINAAQVGGETGGRFDAANFGTEGGMQPCTQYFFHIVMREDFESNGIYWTSLPFAENCSIRTTGCPPLEAECQDATDIEAVGTATLHGTATFPPGGQARIRWRRAGDADWTNGPWQSTSPLELPITGVPDQVITFGVQSEDTEGTGLIVNSASCTLTFPNYTGNDIALSCTPACGPNDAIALPVAPPCTPSCDAGSPAEPAEPVELAPTTANGVDCAGAAVTATGAGVMQSVPHPTAVQQVQICGGVIAGIETGLAQLGCTLDGTGEVDGRVFSAETKPDQTGGVSTFRMVRIALNGTVTDPYVGAWSVCDTDPDQGVRATETSVVGCANGVTVIERRSAYFNANTGAFIAEARGWDSGAGIQDAPPAGFVYGECPAAAQPVDNGINIVRTVEHGCANGTPFTRVTTETFDADAILPTVLGSVVYFQNSAGVQVLEPPGFVLGECAGTATPEIDQYDTAPFSVCYIDNAGQTTRWHTYERVRFNNTTATEVSRVRHWTDGTTDQTVLPTGTPTTCDGVSVLATSEPGCADGVPYTRMRFVYTNTTSGQQLAVVNGWFDSDGQETQTAPANFTLGPCCCDEYLETVCWDDGPNNGRAFAIHRSNTDTIEYIDVITGDLIPAAQIITCPDVLAPTDTVTLIGRSEVTAAGSVVANKHSVTFTNVGTTNATVIGVPLLPGETVTYTAYYDETTRTTKRLPQIFYVASATAILHIAWID